MPESLFQNRTRRLRAASRCAALVVMFLLGAPAVAAQDSADQESAQPERVANGARFGQWAVRCQALAVNETACMLEQRLVRSSDGAFLTELLAFSSPDGTKNYLSARVPVGVYFPHGFAFRPVADEEGEIRMIWQSCSRDMCEALIELDAGTLGELEKAEGGLVGGYRPALLAEPVVFRFSVAGASEGLAALDASRAASGE